MVLMGDLPVLAEDLASVITDALARDAELSPAMERVISEGVLRSACQAMAALVLDYLSRNVPLESFRPTTEMLALTRDMVHLGVPLNTVLRAYLIGIPPFIDRWAAAAVAVPAARSRLADVVAVGSTYILGVHDVMVRRLSEEYRAEDERLARDRDLVRVEAVRRFLADPDADAESASRRIGYRLKGSHTAVVIRSRGGEGLIVGDSHDAAVRRIVARSGADAHLAIRADVRTTWCWLSGTPDTALDIADPIETVDLAVGRLGDGPEGFRRSHGQALDALRIAEITGAPTPCVTLYDRVHLAALCAVDVERCRAFVHDELGRLAADDSEARGHRETLVAYYAADANYRATAAGLGVHHNTVRYRVRQAERLAGRALDKRSLSVELALHLADLINP
ncbi:helix-turn-helix domain-containing protein [Kitasatospora purpeofusca]|uniref:PucR family transcriptional regulator n=1 Tax=Kitasatospora purpeofusca TaxID=67352 RepID=UPI0033BFD63E